MSISIVINAQPDTCLNYSNRNAAIVLGAIGIDTSEGYGEIAFAELPRLRQQALRALHQAGAFQAVAPTDERGPARVVEIDGQPTIQRGVRVIDPGIDEEGVIRRLKEVFSLLAVANELRSGVTWY
ncbi:MAG: hypothetical protein AW12_00295 [Candidatus Accumulibacter sp. BA-94]|uniref:hypothetical protein n=1 Tax=Accumulibacter sp. TaxID=2053492 RepID=UPI000447322B|nr:hypothetical protein [Accumulibacter sp.]EXI92815.1 MAG: hypothetical protein AW12_00295 [Candidatus Accumulibacter sp. BA-94]HRD86676.1 hypothetical protein [Accumulibacter sp.]